LINVVAGVIRKDNKIFCARRKEGLHLAGCWEFPGGKVESGESYEYSLARELEEELCINVSVGPYVGQSTFDYGEKTIRLHAFLVDWKGGEMVLHDHDEIRWLPLDKLDDLNWAPADVPLIHQLKSYMYYEAEASSYVEETAVFEVKESYKEFLESLEPTGRILDLGCGSGRDSIAFNDLGFDVTGIDACPSVAAIASSRTGQPVSVMSYFNMEFESEFDGVWACASLLHSPKTEWLSVFSNILAVLKPGGIAYVSLKAGEGEGFDERGRFFAYCNADELREMLDSLEGVSNLTLWEKEGELRGKQQGWVNVLITKGEDGG